MCACVFVWFVCVYVCLYASLFVLLFVLFIFGSFTQNNNVVYDEVSGVVMFVCVFIRGEHARLL